MIKCTLLNKSGICEASKNNQNSWKAFQLMCTLLAHCWQGLAEGIRQVVLFNVFKWSVKKHLVVKILLAIWETQLQVLFYSFFVRLWKLKIRLVFSASWWYGNKRYVLFIASHALLQRYAEFNRLLWKYFVTCYSCSNYIFVFWHTVKIIFHKINFRKELF